MADILIIDDDPVFCDLLDDVLTEEGHRCVSADSLAAARRVLKAERFDVAFIDVMLPDGNGIDLLSGLPLLPDPPESIIVTANGDPDAAETAITSGAWDYVQKPPHMGRILQMVQGILKAKAGKKHPNLSGTNMIYNCRSMRQTLLEMFEAAQTEAPVLIYGETGTGKELVARGIHHNSRRAGGPFVVVDCGAVAPNLLESELFGYARGAFTGAMQSRQGLVRLADGGTLFLDEVGELTLEQQKVFLRVLQEHAFRPLGSTELVRSNFRVVAASNRNMEEMVKAGSFRSDLLFRLQGCLVSLPPLRQRGDDILLLARHALARALVKYALPIKNFSADAEEALLAYPWPGNVRELIHTVERSALAAGDDDVHSRHLPVHLRAKAVRTRLFGPEEEQQNAVSASDVPAFPSSSQLSENIDETDDAGVVIASPSFSERTEQPSAFSFEAPPSWQDWQNGPVFAVKRRYLLQILQWADGNISKAAAKAGLSRQRLYTLLREHCIARQWREDTAPSEVSSRSGSEGRE